MQLWLILVVIGQFLNSIVSIIDRFIVKTKKVPDPIVYAFFISLFSVASISIYLLGYLPLDMIGLNLPDFSTINKLNVEISFFSLIVGFSFLGAVYFTYSAFTRADASDVVPVVGAVNAITTLGLSYLFFEHVLNNNFLMGFILLVTGTAIISHFRFDLHTFRDSILSGIFFGIHFVASSYMFAEWEFNTAFFWSRFGFGVAALILLAFPKFIQKIKIDHEQKDIQNKKRRKKNAIWILANAVLGGIAGILILKAVDLGQVSIIQALGGLQFVFLIIVSIIIGKMTNEDFGENHSLDDIVQKTAAVIIIATGFGLLFI